MQDDRPPMPQPHHYASDAPYRAPFSGQMPGTEPPWPDADPLRPQAPRRGISSTSLVGALAVSLGANLALIVAVLAVLLFARAGSFSTGVSSTRFTPTHVTSSVATQTAGARPSPTLTAGWLQVAPTTLQLGCDGGQDTQFVVLRNTGTNDVQWQAVFSVAGDQAGVDVSPREGTLRAGTSIALQLQNTSQSGSQQGVIRFEPDSPDAGTAPSLSYTTTGCS